MNNSNSNNNLQTTFFDFTEEIKSLVQKVRSTKNMPTSLISKCEGMILRLIKMSKIGSFTTEFESISEYINVVCSIPWGIYSEERLDLEATKQELEKHHYGLQPVKTRLLEYLAVIKLQNIQQQNKTITNKTNEKDNLLSQNKDVYQEMSKLQGSSSHAPVLCFVGIQGVGKTSMAKSIANALNRKFIRIALGGLASVNELRGVSRTLPNAEPGQIIKALIRTGTMNPLILLDEIDKVSIQTGARADVMAALLEILDPEQNSTFVDKYLDHPVDLSQCMFITTANNLGGISAALLDRLEVIRFGSYTDQDKIMIAKNYLLPKVRQSTGLDKTQLDFEEDVWPLVIRPLGFDAGVRQLERTLTELARKVALKIVMGTTKGVIISKDNFREFIPEDFGIYS